MSTRAWLRYANPIRSISQMSISCCIYQYIIDEAGKVRMETWATCCERISFMHPAVWLWIFIQVFGAGSHVPWLWNITCQVRIKKRNETPKVQCALEVQDAMELSYWKCLFTPCKIQVAQTHTCIRVGDRDIERASQALQKLLAYSFIHHLIDTRGT